MADETLDRLVAFKGELEFLEAKWTDKDGHLAKFAIVDWMDEASNPFKVFTKRRGGRAGTRFYSVLTPIDGAVEEYQGEMMLAGWSDSAAGGLTVTFWCEPGEGMHPFEACRRRAGKTSGTRFAVVLAELDDDNGVVDQTRRERFEAAQGHRLSRLAAQLCRDEDFWQFLTEVILNGSGVIDHESEAAALLRATLNIDTRAELDTNTSAARQFHKRFREPFVEWQEA
jgi:hypothetical protein